MISGTYCQIFGTIYDGFCVPWSLLKFVQLSPHNACAVCESPQLTREKITFCKENCVDCNALHKYILLISHKLHVYCLYSSFTHILQNSSTHYTGTEQLKQEHAREAVVSESVVILSSTYTTNWYTLHLRVRQYVINRCQLFYAFLGSKGP